MGSASMLEETKAPIPGDAKPSFPMTEVREVHRGMLVDSNRDGYQQWKIRLPMAMLSRSPAGINSPALMANSSSPPHGMACWSEWRTVLAMLAVDVVFAVMNTMIKKAIDEGLNRLVLITLRQLVATLFMAPIAYFHERYRKRKHPR
ncbi:hypothetical protein BHM03_00038328 [Ensete ventricosum]|uniref:WAT1-related protein n=1 Tax=Ensete ventricosum TaxID=4639 RepID=A0A445MJU9_ENSVE|nr:hypothetical protein BHM03_00038328 [Ensete ventricosum]